jgi:hypothetical protein
MTDATSGANPSLLACPRLRRAARPQEGVSGGDGGGGREGGEDGGAGGALLVDRLSDMALEGHLLLDPGTLSALSIFRPERHPSLMGIGTTKEGFSVYGLLNRCTTPMVHARADCAAGTACSTRALQLAAPRLPIQRPLAQVASSHSTS